MAEATVASYGGIDLLVNNAAIYGAMEFDLLVSVDWDYYKKFMGVNMDGALVMTRAVYRHMQARGGGAIVNQSSTAAYLYSGFYGLAKVGINGLTQQLAHELGGMGIRVNAIAPGPTDTEATRTQAGDAAKEMVKGLAIKRMGQPEDMVGACLFLLSDEAAWVTGQILAVDGGQVSGREGRLRRSRQHRQADGAAAGRVRARADRVRRRTRSGRGAGRRRRLGRGRPRLARRRGRGRLRDGA